MRMLYFIGYFSCIQILHTLCLSELVRRSNICDSNCFQLYLVNERIHGNLYICPSTCRFCDNMIVTSKYKITTFIPVNLFEQFSRAVNLYFLLISVIQLIPGLSPTGIETTLVPLLFVLLVNALKDAHYDYKRHKSDAEV